MCQGDQLRYFTRFSIPALDVLDIARNRRASLAYRCDRRCDSPTRVERLVISPTWRGPVRAPSSGMRLLGNILWLVLGGFWMAIGWFLAGLIMAISIVGLPWARSCFVIGELCFMPFGREAIDRGTGPLGFIGNVVWFVFAGLWLAIGHVMSALACFITIIGIPFGLQHLKLAVLALAPVGKTVVESR